MVVLRWVSGALALALILVLPAGQAGYPDCRDVTEGLPSEVYDGHYVYVADDRLEEWQEWNGYTGLQRYKCLTETGIILGSDTLTLVVPFDDPLHPGGPDAPEVPGVPALPGTPQIPPEIPPWPICDRPEGAPLTQVVDACIAWLGEPPETPDWDGPEGGVCGGPGNQFLVDQMMYCIPPVNTDPDDIVDYIDWVQYVLGSGIDFVIDLLLP